MTKKKQPKYCDEREYTPVMMQLTPDIIDMVEKLGLEDELTAEVYGMLSTMPPYLHQRFMLEIYDSLYDETCGDGDNSDGWDDP